MFPVTTPFNIVLEDFANSIRQEKVIKSTQIRKENIKLSLFTGYLVVYVERLKELSKKLLDLIGDYCKTAGYKLNI